VFPLEYVHSIVNIHSQTFHSLLAEPSMLTTSIWVKLG